MSPYRINYLGPDHRVGLEEMQWFEDDDHALDAVGRSPHRDEIEVRQGDRLVARFPPTSPVGIFDPRGPRWRI
ncbi:MAG TPA: hypothetical protein VGF42_06505 [Caulobacteraceae bacterium]